MDSSDLKRRQVLKSGGILASGVAIAGCSESSEPASSSSAETGAGVDESDPSSDTDTEESESETSEPVESEDLPSLEHLHGISGDLTPSATESYHDLRFEWEALGGSWWIENQISKSLGEYYKKRTGRSGEFQQYVADTYDQGVISTIVEQFESLQEEYDLSKREVVDLAVGFVQGLRYTEDSVTSSYDQYSNYPVETLIQQGGDCEDSAILMAALIQELGYGCVLLELRPSDAPNHMALGILGDRSINGTYYEYNDNRYYFLETTGKGWGVGDIPDDYRDTSATITELGPHPSLVYRWNTEYEEDTGEILLNVTVWNVGDGIATEAEFIAEFEDRSEEIREGTEHSLGLLEPEGGEEFELQLNPPEDVSLRLNTGVLLNGDLHEVQFSEYQDPI